MQSEFVTEMNMMKKLKRFTVACIAKRDYL